VVDHGRFAVDAHQADVRAVHGAAHVDAAGQGHAHGCGHTHVIELVEQGVHHAFHRAGSVGGGRVAVHPALGVDHVADAGARAAHGELEGAAGELAGVQVVAQGLHGGFVVHHEFNVVTGGPTQIAAAVLVGDVAQLTDMGDGHGTGAADAHGVDLVAAFGHMHQYAGLQNFMIEPLAEVLFDHRREIVVVLMRADVGDTAFHGFLGIVPGRNKSHVRFPLILALMAFTEFGEIAIPAAGHFLFLKEDEGIGTRRFHLAGHGRRVGDFQQLLEGEALHGFAHALAVFAFFHPPIPDLFDDFFDIVIGGFTGDEGNKQRTHLRAVHHRGLGAHQNAGAALVADVQGAGHGVDAVHAAHAVGSLDGELGTVPLHALAGATVNDFLLDVELAPVAPGMRTRVGFDFAGQVGFDLFLVDLDVVLPGAHHGEVGTGQTFGGGRSRWGSRRI
jgi:hypothetical protein